MVELCKNGFFVRMQHDSGKVRVELVCVEPEGERIAAMFICAPGDLSSVLSGATLQLSDGLSNFLLITAATDDITVSFESNVLGKKSGCTVARDAYSKMITVVSSPVNPNR